jgi:ArsR family transcriptional regulator, arsenate/arsenite/antimonite-responsive transcriptional repressor
MKIQKCTRNFPGREPPAKYQGKQKMKDTVELFRALADITRLRIMRVLVKSKTPLCVCEIVDALDLPQYLISRHLKVLRHVGAVENSRQGTWILYTIYDTSPVLSALLPTLNQNLVGEFIAEDDRRLSSRIARRINGKCVFGVRCCDHNKKSK